LGFRTREKNNKVQEYAQFNVFLTPAVCVVKGSVSLSSRFSYSKRGTLDHGAPEQVWTLPVTEPLNQMLHSAETSICLTHSSAHHLQGFREKSVTKNFEIMKYREQFQTRFGIASGYSDTLGLEGPWIESRSGGGDIFSTLRTHEHRNIGYTQRCHLVLRD
jgi:hypothetical protein